MTADPASSSGDPSDPQSWNRYAYTRGDPVNRIDPSGRTDCSPEEPGCRNDICDQYPNLCFQGGGGGGGKSPAYPKCNPNGSVPVANQIAFIENNYQAAAAVAAEADNSFQGLNAQNFNAADVLGWAAAESGYLPPGQNPDSGLKSGNLDYFNLTAGSNWLNQVACPQGYNHYWACFGSFQGAAQAALFSPTPGSYQGVPNASAGYILGQQLGSGASLGAAFDAMNAATHFAQTANYGSGPQGVQAVTNSLSSILNCLQQNYGLH
jgi:hypothetical protein